MAKRNPNTPDPRRVALLEDFRRTNPDEHSATAISKATGVHKDAVRRWLRSNGVGPTTPADTADAPPANLPKVGISVEGDVYGLVSENPCTLEELLKACNVDLKVWHVARHVVNKWEVGTRNDDGTVRRTPLFQIKAWLERPPGADVIDALRETIEEISAGSTVPKFPPPDGKGDLAIDDPHCLEVSLPDIHIGKLTWAPEVGEHYDLKIAPTRAMQAAHALWAKAQVFPITRILLPLGNDYFNVNNAAGTTAAGTPQDEEGRWKKSFKVGVKLAVELIEFFRGKAVGGIDVMMVPGNHDPERLYYLGCVLEGIYNGSVDVRINNGEKARKYFRFGTTLLGFTHGHGEKHDKLPLIMAAEAAKDWAETTHHEIHLGHLHHKKETLYHTGREFGPVRVRILPSLCPADEWHFTSGYVGAKRAAEAYLWSFKNGYTGHLSWSPAQALT